MVNVQECRDYALLRARDVVVAYRRLGPIEPGARSDTVGEMDSLLTLLDGAVRELEDAEKCKRMSYYR